MRARLTAGPQGDLLTGLAGAAVCFAVETAALGGRPAGLVAVLAALFAALGLAAGLLLAAQEAVVRALRLRADGVAAALIRGAGALVALVPATRHLFDGAFASTLPAARLGRLWAPAAGWLLVAAAVWIGGRLGRRVAGAVLALAWAGAQLVNRTVLRSEYPDLHTLLTVAGCLVAGLALRLLVAPAATPAAAAAPAPDRRGRRLPAALVVLTALGVAAALRFGLRDRASRWRVATHGMDGRLLVGLGRDLLDRDGDGYAALLGGGDCDDGDARRSPAAAETPGNDLDEDCDGEATPAPPPPAPATADEEAAAAWWTGPEAAALLARTRGMNVLLVSVDALRADVLDGAAARRRFPHLTGLLAGSRFFIHAFAPAAGTDISVSAALTGRYSPFVPLDTTLAEGMQRTGRATFAVVPSEVLRYAPATLLLRGLDGHDRLVNDPDERDVGSASTSARTTDLGLRWLDRRPRGRPFFLWLHFFDVHEHFQIEDADEALQAAAAGADLADPAERYRVLVTVVDREVGRLLDGLAARGLDDDTIVVLISDHGESLGDDPRLPVHHGRFVYNPLVHIPLAVRIPGVAAAEVAAPVSLVDLMPTLLSLAGAPRPDGVDGENLLPHLADAAPESLRRRPRLLAMTDSEQWAVIAWPYKLLVRPQDNLRELYQLDRDFGEQRDLSEQEPARVRELTAGYKRLPSPPLDRTRHGRRQRELAAQPPRSP